MANILILHGPNLNRLGTRENALYGNVDLNTIDTRLSAQAKSLGHTLRSFQSNAESALIDEIHSARDVHHTDFILFNPAAFTHTSIALRDAMLAVKIPFIEVHLSNILARESFRHHSYFSDIAVGVVAGFGALSYELALTAANHYLTQN